jgi:hypothetical protein
VLGKPTSDIWKQLQCYNAGASEGVSDAAKVQQHIRGLKSAKSLGHDIISYLKAQNGHARDVCTTGPIDEWFHLETMSRKLPPFQCIIDDCHSVGCASFLRIVFLVPNHQPS